MYLFFVQFWLFHFAIFLVGDAYTCFASFKILQLLTVLDDIFDATLTLIGVLQVTEPRQKNHAMTMTNLYRFKHKICLPIHAPF